MSPYGGGHFWVIHMSSKTSFDMPDVAQILFFFLMFMWAFPFIISWCMHKGYGPCHLLIRECTRKIFFLFLYENICCGYSLEVPQWGTSNEYPQHMFSYRNKKIINTFQFEKKCLICRAVEIPCLTCPTCPISLRTSKKFQFTCPGTSNS